MDEAVSRSGIFVEATKAKNPSCINDGVYFFDKLNLKMNLGQDLFDNDRKIVRVAYTAHFMDKKIMRCDIGSYVNGKRVPIDNNLTCRAPEFVIVEAPILQTQLNLDGTVSDVELKVIRNQIGITSITVSIEDVREPYTGSLE